MSHTLNGLFCNKERILISIIWQGMMIHMAQYDPDYDFWFDLYFLTHYIYSLKTKNSEILNVLILTYFRWIHTCPKKLFGVFNQSLPLVWRWTWCSWISGFFWWNFLFWSCSFGYIVSWRFQKMRGNSWWTVKRW